MTMTDSKGTFYILHNGRFQAPRFYDDCFARMNDGTVYARCVDGEWH